MNKPTKPGWYWYRYNGIWGPVKVVLFYEELKAIGDAGIIYSLDEWPGEWRGPIPTPNEALDFKDKIAGPLRVLIRNARPLRGWVWCRNCMRRQRVNATRCLKHGWPKCCGCTMTIDPPNSEASNE